MGRCRRSRRRGRTHIPPPHSWGGVGGADGGAEPKNIAPPHSWGGVGGADGGAEPSSSQRVVESDYTRNRELRPTEDTHLTDATHARTPPGPRPRGRAAP